MSVDQYFLEFGLWFISSVLPAAFFGMYFIIVANNPH